MRFFSTLVAATLGSLIALGMLFFFGFLFLIALAASSGQSATPRVLSQTVLVMDLEGSIPEVAANDPFATAFGGSSTPDLLAINRALRMAAADDRIDAVWLQLGALGSGWATLQEVRAALERYKASGKPLYASGISPMLTEAEYFLASAADSVFLAPGTLFEFNGFVLTAEFYKPLLDRMNIGVEVIRAGTFKAATEPFTRTDLSPENRTQLNALLQAQNTVFMNTVAASRNTTAEALNERARTNPVLTAEGALEAGLVDGLKTFAQVEDFLTTRFNREDLRTVSLATYAQSNPKDAGLEVPSSRANQVAIVYANGAISDGEESGTPNPLTGGSTDVKDRPFVEAMQEAVESERVSAIVLRINSPGGSVSASEAMRAAIAEAAAVKPVIVSMGDVAASGGYWIATAADTILAQPLTITGSIGVFSLSLRLSDFLTNKVGITFDQVETSPFAGMFSGIQPLQPAGRALLQTYVDSTYSDFLGLVQQARGYSREQADNLGQGRVWIGTDALELGLVDAHGGLYDALRIAAERGGIDPDMIPVRILPRQKTTLERLTEGLNSRVLAWSSRSPIERQVRELVQTLEGFAARNHAVQAWLPLHLHIR